MPTRRRPHPAGPRLPPRPDPVHGHPPQPGAEGPVPLPAERGQFPDDDDEDFLGQIFGNRGVGAKRRTQSVEVADPFGSQGDRRELEGRGPTFRSQLQRLRGRVISLIPQDPTVYLNPTMRIGAQVAEAVKRRGDVPKRLLSAEVVDLLGRVGLDDPVARAPPARRDIRSAAERAARERAACRILTKD